MPPWVTGRRSSSPPDGDEGRVEDRHREHEQRQEDGRQRRARRRPARRERERREPEADHLASRVAHEERRAPARPQVEGEEAETGAAEGESDDEHEVALVAGDRLDCEDGTRHRRQRGGEAVHVVEQVERVRDPNEPEQAQSGREDV